MRSQKRLKKVRQYAISSLNGAPVKRGTTVFNFVFACIHGHMQFIQVKIFSMVLHIFFWWCVDGHSTLKLMAVPFFWRDRAACICLAPLNWPAAFTCSRRHCAITSIAHLLVQLTSVYETASHPLPQAVILPCNSPLCGSKLWLYFTSADNFSLSLQKNKTKQKRKNKLEFPDLRLLLMGPKFDPFLARRWVLKQRQ